MINKAEFDEINKELKRLEDLRENSIKISRSIINLSKQIIHNLHKNDIKKAEEFVKEINKLVKALPNERANDLNIDITAIQEYVEAVAYYELIKNNKLPTRKELNVDTITYLMGLCDLTGELIRKITNLLINDKMGEAKKIKDIISEIYNEFVHLDIHHGELRKKADMLRWNMEKAEDVLLRSKK